MASPFAPCGSSDTYRSPPPMPRTFTLLLSSESAKESRELARKRRVRPLNKTRRTPSRLVPDGRSAPPRGIGLAAKVLLLASGDEVLTFDDLPPELLATGEVANEIGPPKACHFPRLFAFEEGVQGHALPPLGLQVQHPQYVGRSRQPEATNRRPLT